MPTYEYECSECEDIFEVFQSMTDERIKKCPACGGKVSRLFGAGAGIIFKGSGFYETDYRGNSYQNDAKKDSSSSSAPSAENKKSSSKKSGKKKEKSGSKTTAASSSKSSKKSK